MVMIDQWDIIEFDFSPAIGHESQGRRPALVVSNNAFNLGTSMTLICPITSTNNGFPLHFCLPEHLDIRGYIVAEQVRAFDLQSRRVERIESLNDPELSAALAECIKSFI
jgi:mRNA interferase MazF